MSIKLDEPLHLQDTVSNMFRFIFGNPFLMMFYRYELDTLFNECTVYTEINNYLREPIRKGTWRRSSKRDRQLTAYL